MDEAKLTRLHWKIMFISGMGFFTDAYDLFIIGVVRHARAQKRIYGYEVLVLAVGAVASAFSPNIWWLIVFRIILGIGIGGDYPVSVTIMSEYASRGRAA